MGPLHTPAAVKEYSEGLQEIVKQGGKILYGGYLISSIFFFAIFSFNRGCVFSLTHRRNVLKDRAGNFVEPAIVESKHDLPIVKTELFVPILHVIKFSTIDDAIEYNNEVPQGLSSSLFTNNQMTLFKWVGMLFSHYYVTA